MSQADADRLLVSRSGTPVYGRTDGVAVVPDAGGSSTTTDGLVAVSNGDVSMTLDHSMFCEVFEDFLGATTIQATGSLDTASGPWAIKDTSSAGAPTKVISGDADNGQLALAFASNTEAEILTLFWNDELNIDSDQEPVVVFRLQIDQAPLDSNTSLVFGLASAQNDTLNSVANHAWFLLTGANSDLLIESDDATTDNDDDDTGVDLSATTMYEFMVSTSALHGASATDVRYFYRSTLGGDWTALNGPGTSLSGTTYKVGADIALQPFLQFQKASDANTDGIKIDYVRVYWKRV